MAVELLERGGELLGDLRDARLGQREREEEREEEDLPRRPGSPAGGTDPQVDSLGPGQRTDSTQD